MRTVLIAATLLSTTAMAQEIDAAISDGGSRQGSQVGILLQPGTYDVYTEEANTMLRTGPVASGKILVTEYADAYGTHHEETWVLYDNYIAPDLHNGAKTRIRTQSLAPVLNTTDHTQFVADITADCAANGTCDPANTKVARWLDGRETVATVSSDADLCASLNRQSVGFDCLSYGTGNQIGDIPVLIIGGIYLGNGNLQQGHLGVDVLYGYASVPTPTADSGTFDGQWWTEFWMVFQEAPVLGTSLEIVMTASLQDGDAVYNQFVNGGSHGGIWDYGYDYLPGYAPLRTATNAEIERYRLDGPL